MKRWLVLLALLPNCTGCLAYGYPTLAYTPMLTVPNHDNSAHAYRVDVDRTERTAAPTTSQYTLSKIPLDERGNVPSQLELASATGVYDPLGVASGATHERNLYTMLVRLYRPGHRLIEVQSWDKTRDLNWSKAKDLGEEERAVDDLVADPNAPMPVSFGGAQLRPVSWWVQKDQKSPPLGLQPGRGASDAHR